MRNVAIIERNTCLYCNTHSKETILMPYDARKLYYPESWDTLHFCDVNKTKCSLYTWYALNIELVFWGIMHWNGFRTAMHLNGFLNICSNSFLKNHAFNWLFECQFRHYNSSKEKGSLHLNEFIEFVQMSFKRRMAFLLPLITYLIIVAFNWFFECQTRPFNCLPSEKYHCIWLGLVAIHTSSSEDAWLLKINPISIVFSNAKPDTQMVYQMYRTVAFECFYHLQTTNVFQETACRLLALMTI